MCLARVPDTARVGAHTGCLRAGEEPRDRLAVVQGLFLRAGLLKDVITPLLAPHLWPFPSRTRWLPPGLHSVSVSGWREARPGTGPFPSHPCCRPLQEGSPSLDLVLSPALPYCKGNDRMSHGKRAASCTSWDLLASCELSGLHRAMGK